MFKRVSENLSLFLEFMEFLFVRKKWWLIPLMLFVLLFGLLAIAASISPLLPFIYPLV